MIIPAKVDRLDLAEQVLVSWEQMLAAGVLTIENLSLATSEVANLQAYRSQDLDRADDLIRRFQAIATALAARRI